MVSSFRLFPRYAISGFSLALLAACSTTSVVKPVDEALTVVPGEPVYQPSDFVEAVPETIEAKLGMPSLTRREGEGEYRRYDLATCALIIILYPDDRGELRTVHMDVAATSSGQAKPDLESCLAAG